MPMKLKPRSIDRGSLRLSRRSALKSVGAAAGLALTSLLPKGIFAASQESAHQVTPHWDRVMQHVKESSPHDDRDVEGLLLSWISDLVLEPSVRREALVVHGPQASGKTALHNAMSTLVNRGEYLHGCDEHAILNWGLQPGRRLAAFERGNLNPPDRRRRDAALSKQVHSFEFKELLWGSNDPSWQPGIDTHRNALFWYEAVLETRPFTCALPRRTTKMCGGSIKILETHIYLGKVEKPIPRLDLIRYLEDESSAFKERLKHFRES